MAEFDAQDVLERSLAAHTVKSGNQDFNQLGGSIGVLHEPTGLFVNVGAGTEDDNLVEKTTRFAGTRVSTTARTSRAWQDNNLRRVLQLRGRWQIAPNYRRTRWRRVLAPLA
jgi:hypothetical protein